MTDIDALRHKYRSHIDLMRALKRTVAFIRLEDLERLLECSASSTSSQASAGSASALNEPAASKPSPSAKLSRIASAY